MSFLAKSLKTDLINLATELNLNVKSDMKVIELRNLIINDKDYDEEFTKELLNTIMQQRKEEQQKKEEEQQKKEDEQRRKEEKEEQRRKEEKEEHQRKEEEERRNKEIEFELRKLELTAKASEERPQREADFTYKVDLQRLIPKFNSKEDDISLYLVMFERQAKVLGIPETNWVPQLIGLLPTEIINIIAREPENMHRTIKM